MGRLVFVLNATETALALLWLIGLVCALIVYGHYKRDVSGALLIVVAVVLPVVGSLAGVATYVSAVRRERRKEVPMTTVV